MITGLDGLKDEYLGEEKAERDALRLPIAFADDWLFTDNRSDFSLGGHRLSSLYRTFESAISFLTNRYFAAFSSQKYSPGVRGWKTPAGRDHTKAQTE